MLVPTDPPYCLLRLITTYHSSSSIFMTKNTPTGMKMFKTAWLFLDGFQTNSSISYLTVHQPITYSPLWSLTRRFELVTEELWLCSDAIFKIVCMCSNHLAMKQLLFKIVELEILLCAWRQGDALASIVDSVFEESLVNDYSANSYCIHLLRKPMRTDLLLWDRWQTSAQTCTCF